MTVMITPIPRWAFVKIPRQASHFNNMLSCGRAYRPDGGLSYLFSVELRGDFDPRRAINNDDRRSGARKGDWMKRMNYYAAVAYAVLALGDDVSAKTIQRWCSVNNLEAPKSERFIWKARRILRQEELLWAHEKAREEEIACQDAFQKYLDEENKKCCDIH